MREEFSARIWAERHQDLSTAVAALLRSVMQAFCVLHRVSWNAPWAEEKRCCD